MVVAKNKGLDSDISCLTRYRNVVVRKSEIVDVEVGLKQPEVPEEQELTWVRFDVE